MNIKSVTTKVVPTPFMQHMLNAMEFIPDGSIIGTKIVGDITFTMMDADDSSKNIELSFPNAHFDLSMNRVRTIVEGNYKEAMKPTIRLSDYYRNFPENLKDLLDVGIDIHINGHSIANNWISGAYDNVYHSIIDRATFLSNNKEAIINLLDQEMDYRIPRSEILKCLDISLTICGFSK